MPTLATVVAAAEALWPPHLAEPWDHPGLVVGRPDAEVSSVWLVVDVTRETVAEALDSGADLIIAHHPLLFRPVDSVAAVTSRGDIIHRLIAADVALLSAHTNADRVATGTSAVLAARLGLTDCTPIVPGTGAEGGGAAEHNTGLGVIGHAPEASTLGSIARALAHVLPATARGVAGSGTFDAPVRTVAVCAGAGDSLLGDVAAAAVDLYITSDLRHHPASDFRSERRADGAPAPALIDISHWAAEWLWLDQAAAELRTVLPGVEVSVSDLRTDVWDFVVTQ